MTKTKKSVTLELKGSKGSTLKKSFPTEQAKELLERKSGWEISKSEKLILKDGDFISSTGSGNNQGESSTQGS